MTEEQKLSLLKAMIDTDEEDVSDETLSAYLFLAGRKIMKKRYPFHFRLVRCWMRRLISR